MDIREQKYFTVLKNLSECADFVTRDRKEFDRRLNEITKANGQAAKTLADSKKMMQDANKKEADLLKKADAISKAQDALDKETARIEKKLKSDNAKLERREASNQAEDKRLKELAEDMVNRLNAIDRREELVKAEQANIGKLRAAANQEMEAAIAARKKAEADAAEAEDRLNRIRAAAR